LTVSTREDLASRRRPPQRPRSTGRAIELPPSDVRLRLLHSEDRFFGSSELEWGGELSPRYRHASANMVLVERANRTDTGYRGPWVIQHAGWVAISGTVVGLILLVTSIRYPTVFAAGLSPRLGPKERADVLGAGRDAGFKLAAAAGALAAGILAWGRLDLATDERKVAHDTLDAQYQALDAQRQTLDAQRLTGDADRFARAVDQMGGEKATLYSVASTLSRRWRTRRRAIRVKSPRCSLPLSENTYPLATRPYPRMLLGG
jgi:hypothetical protein